MASGVYWEARRKRWFARIEAADALDGKPHWPSTGIKEPKDEPTKKGREAAMLWLQNHLKDQFRHKVSGTKPVEPITFEQQCLNYLKKIRIDPDSSDREAGIVRYAIGFKVGNTTMGKMPLASITSDNLQDLLESKSEKVVENEDGTTYTEPTPGNAKRYRITLHAIFQAAVDALPDPLIQKNPVDVTETEYYDDKRTREMKPEEEARMMPFLLNKQRYPGQFRLGRIITFALYTLQRKKEIFKLCWRDVDLTERTMPDGTKSYGVITILSKVKDPTKGRAARKVEIYPPLRDLLLEMRAEAMAEVAGTPAAIEDRHIFLSRDGERYVDIKTTWNTLMEKAGIQDLHFHDLRHTGAMRFFRLGVPPLVLQSMLGHKDLQQTQRYLGLVGQEQTPSLNRAWATEQAMAQRQSTVAVGK